MQCVSTHDCITDILINLIIANIFRRIPPLPCQKFYEICKFSSLQKSIICKKLRNRLSTLTLIWMSVKKKDVDVRLGVIYDSPGDQ
jgi:hypothetical protein